MARFVDEDVMLRASQRLEELRQLLKKPGSPDALKQISTYRVAVAKPVSNGQLLLHWACSTATFPNAPDNQGQNTLSLGDNNAPRNANWPQFQNSNGVSQQAIANSTENLSRNGAVEAQKIATLPQPALKGKTGSGTWSLSGKEAPTGKSKSKSKKNNEPIPSIVSILEDDSPVPPQDGSRSLQLAASPPLPAPTPTPSQAKPLQGFWIENALLLTREAKLDGATVVQGVWLDWLKLREQWRNEVKDLFPNAQLATAPNLNATARPEDDPLRLASLPVRLVPGELPLPPLPFWSPLRGSLAVA